jgi:hypothetical protein
VIKTTLMAIEKALPALTAQATAKLPVKAAYGLAKLRDACTKEMERYLEQRDKLFKDANCVIKDDKWTHPDSALYASLVKQSEELASVEVEINALPLDLEQYGNAELPGNSFFMLEWALKKTEA